MSAEALEALVADASQLASDGNWEAAGARWKEAAALSRAHGAHRSAAMCSEQEGECWRRADHATYAEQALQQALGQPEPPSDPVTTCARLAAVLAERGAGRRALAVGRQAVHMARQTGHGALPAAVDTLLGLLQGFGRKADQRPLLEALEQHLGPESPAVAFRRGQLLRLDGRLDEADACLAVVEGALRGVPGAEAGVAGASMERAEIGLLQGRTEGAVEAFTRAYALHRDAGRRALAWRCEVGRVRASVRVGLEPMAPGLDQAMAWASRRGLALLEVDLRTARGLSRVQRDPDAARADLLEAAHHAGAMGAGPRVGRIYLHLVAYLSTDAAPEWRALAEEGLADNVPLLAELRQIDPSP